MASLPLSLQTDTGWSGRRAGRRVITDSTNHATTAITASGVTDYVDVRYAERVAIGVVNGAAEDCDFTVEGSFDGTNWVTVAYGSGSSAAYTQASKNIAISGDEILFLPPDDFFYFVRVNISDANATNGTTFTVYGA